MFWFELNSECSILCSTSKSRKILKRVEEKPCLAINRETQSTSCKSQNYIYLGYNLFFLSFPLPSPFIFHLWNYRKSLIGHIKMIEDMVIKLAKFEGSIIWGSPENFCFRILEISLKAVKSLFVYPLYHGCHFVLVNTHPNVTVVSFQEPFKHINIKQGKANHSVFSLLQLLLAENWPL